MPNDFPKADKCAGSRALVPTNTSSNKHSPNCQSFRKSTSVQIARQNSRTILINTSAVIEKCVPKTIDGGSIIFSEARRLAINLLNVFCNKLHSAEMKFKWIIRLINCRFVPDESCSGHGDDITQRRGGGGKFREDAITQFRDASRGWDKKIIKRLVLFASHTLERGNCWQRLAKFNEEREL